MSVLYLELIENFLASELEVGFDSQAIKVCDSLTEDQLSFFRHQFYDIDKSQHDLMIRSDPRLSLPVSEKVSEADWKDEGIKPTSAMFTHPYNDLKPLDIEHIKRQLLFFSRVALIVPSLKFCSELHESREQFKSFLKAFLDLKLLVKDGTVELLPLSGFYSNEIEGGAGIVRKACHEDPEIRKWIKSNQAMLADFALGARRGDPYFDAGIRICSSLTYGHTLAATHPFVGLLYKQLLTDSVSVDRSVIGSIKHLDKIHLPGLGGLDWQDIRSIRQNEDCLEQWRADLRVAITSVDPDLPPDKFIERFNSQVQAQLSRAALELNRELKKSSSLERFKKGSNNLAISAIAGTTKFFLGGPFAAWDEIRKILQTVGAKEAIRFIWESKEESAKRSLRSHYSVFVSNDH